MQVASGHGRRDSDILRCEGGRNEPSLAPGEVIDNAAGVAVECTHVKELRQAAGHGIDSLRDHDRGAQRRRGAGNVDNLALTEFGTNFDGHRKALPRQAVCTRHRPRATPRVDEQLSAECIQPRFNRGPIV